MKKLLFLTTTLVTLGLVPAFAQFGPRGGGQGPKFDGAMDKLFGDHQAFSANLEFQTSGSGMGDVSVPGQMSFDGGKSRFEMNLSDIKNGSLPAGAAEHMKAMGMDNMVSIARPDLKLTYLVYPGLTSYAETPITDTNVSAKPEDYKASVEKLGVEAVNGHDCVKNKVTVTDKENTNHVYTVWNAADLKNFPVKIVTAEDGTTNTMLFKNVSFSKPAASNFELPSGYTKYSDAQTMMRTEMMKKMGGMAMPTMPTPEN